LAENDSWLRFHSLPGSRRYAETGDETSIILDRQNIIAAEVLGNETSCWMIGHLYASDGDANEDDAWRREHRQHFQRNKMKRIQRLPDPHDPDVTYDIFATKAVWRRGVFDETLRAIANDEVRVMWMSDVTGAIFAPYDGGMDLILASTDHIRALKLSHSDWLSPHPEAY
jgi:hypothetical protein